MYELTKSVLRGRAFLFVISVALKLVLNRLV